MSTLSASAIEKRQRAKFKKFQFQGMEMEKLLKLKNEELAQIVTCRSRRRFNRGLPKKSLNLIKKLRKAKKETPYGEKPKTVKTHLRNMIIVPEMIDSVVGVYNGHTYVSVEIKPDMIGHQLGEFSLTYKPVKHGRPGIGATSSSKFVPLK